MYHNGIVYKYILFVYCSNIWVMHMSVFQDTGHHRLSGHDNHRSIFVNEAAFTSPSLNNRHIHLQHPPHSYHQTVHLHSGYSDSSSAQNSLNSLLARSNHRQSSAGESDAPAGHESWTGGTMYSTPGRSLREIPNNGNVFTAITSSWVVLTVDVGRMRSLMFLSFLFIYFHFLVHITHPLK